MEEKKIEVESFFLIIIPIYSEKDLIEDLVENIFKEFNDNSVKKNIDILLVTHISQDCTINALMKKLEQGKYDINIKYMVNTDNDHSKAGQLSYVLKNHNIDRYDYISIYDCDSKIDQRAFRYIDYISKNKKHNLSVYQQIPFYPTVYSNSFLETIALSRNIHSLNYTYSCELITFKKSMDHNPFRMSTHLLGHGEHLSLETINYGRGFNPPFCDSSLGFSLSFRDVPIYIVPITDISISPSHIKDSYQQGIRWYAGCDLYWREFFLIKKINLNHIIKIFLTIINNIRWSMLPIISFLLVFKDLYFFSALLIILFIRHILLFFSYNQLYKISNMSQKNQKINIIKWSLLFITYCIMRLIWSIAPIDYYIKLVLKKQIKKIATPKDPSQIIKN